MVHSEPNRLARPCAGHPRNTDVKWTGSVPTEPWQMERDKPGPAEDGNVQDLGPGFAERNSGRRLRPPTICPRRQPSSPRSRISRAPLKPTLPPISGNTQWAVCASHQYWADQMGRLVLEYRLDNDPPLAARAYALHDIAVTDAGIACWDSKYAYWAIRPFQLDPEVKPLFPTPNHPSYPAAHGCFSTYGFASNNSATVLAMSRNWRRTFGSGIA